MIKKYLTFIFILLNCQVAVSINTDQWLIQNIQVDDGLPSATIFSVQQDHTGYLWFGTINGVTRYDGYDFKAYQHDGADLNTISNNNAGNIYIDSNNTLWIGTFGGGFNSMNLDTGAITRFPYSSNNNDMLVSPFVQTFFEDTKSNMWIGTPNGLYKFKDKIVNHYQHEEDDSNSLIHSRVWSIVEGPSSNMWVGTTQGLSKLNPLTNEITNYNLPINLIEDISSNEFRKLFFIDNKLWIGSSSGLFVFDLQAEEFKSYPLKYNIKINDLKLIGTKLLLATAGGLYQFDMKTFKFVTDANNNLWHSMANLDLRQIIIDRSGLMWFATRDSGVFKINQTGGLFNNQATLSSDSKLNEQSKKIWAIEFDKHGNTYLGTSDTLIIKSQDGAILRVGTTDANHIPGRIRSLKWSQKGDLWIGSIDGLFVLRNGKTVAEKINQPFDTLNMKPADIYSIEETDKGELWLSLNNLGILRWHPETNEAQLLQKFQGMLLTDLNIGKIIQDSDQNIWVTTNLVGLIKFNPTYDKMTTYSYDYSGKNSISSNRVRDILEDKFGRLWIGTARGVNLYNPTTNLFKVLNQNDGLLDQSIYALSEDSNNNIWASHSFGISRINKTFDDVKYFKINSSIKKDGLSIRAANISSDDVMHFGSINGLYTFNPNDLYNCAQYQPQLLLNQVSINNLPMSTHELNQSAGHFETFYDDHSISFNFAALEFNSPEQVRYHYKVSEIHNNWHEASHSRHVELTGLKPGTYHLAIKASNSDCRWSEQTLNITLQVHPAWWNLWWVRILFTLLILAGAFLLHYFRSDFIRKRNLALEKLVKSRTSELMKLNKKLESASQTDFLTGLYNRTGFINQFKSIIATPQSHIVLADIDNFKKINDLYGHLAGDEVLKKVTRIMRMFIQKVDFVARWGGEEFIFYFFNESNKNIFKIVEQIRLEIEKSAVQYEGDSIKVTCTFGICQIKQGMDLYSCIKSADESLYEGKSAGRNVTVVSK